jgi:CRP/FNR family transcriptional regulator, anaerobic regulatory protein
LPDVWRQSLVPPVEIVRKAEDTLCENCRLRDQPHFKPFSKGELRFISTLKTGQVRARTGETIVEAGESRRQLYTLWEGWAFSYMSLPDGRRQIIDFLLPGDLIGLDGWMNGIYSCSVGALTTVTLCVLDGLPPRELFENQAELSMLLVQKMLDQLDRSNKMALSLGRRQATQRLGHLMLDTFDRLAERGIASGNSCPFPLKRRDLADALGLSEAHVSRAAAELYEKSLADISASTLTIFDRAALTTLSQYVPATNPRPKHSNLLL